MAAQEFFAGATNVLHSPASADASNPSAKFRFLSLRRFSSAMPLAGIAALAVCAVVWLTMAFPQRFPALARMESAEQTLKADPCLVGNRDQPNLSLSLLRCTRLPGPR